MVGLQRGGGGMILFSKNATIGLNSCNGGYKKKKIRCHVSLFSFHLSNYVTAFVPLFLRKIVNVQSWITSECLTVAELYNFSDDCVLHGLFREVIWKQPKVRQVLKQLLPN